MTGRKGVGDDSDVTRGGADPIEGQIGQEGDQTGQKGQKGQKGRASAEALSAVDIAILGQDSPRRHLPRWPWIILLVIFLFASIFGVLIWKRTEHNSALRDCRDAAGTSVRARARLRKTLDSIASTSASVTSKQVSDGKVVDELRTEMAAASSVMGSNGKKSADEQCPVGSSTASLKSSTVSAATSSRAMTRQEKRVRAASAAVIAGRDAKTLADAQGSLSTLVAAATTLLDSAEGQTAETEYRDKLSTRITAAQDLVRTKAGDVSADDLAERCRDGVTSLQAAMDDLSASITRQSGIDCDVLKCVALTFDDGPSADNDVKLRDELEKLKVKATFFMIGRNVTSTTSANISRDMQLGNIDGNHSWDHPQLSTLSRSAIGSELSRTDAVITAAGGRRSGLLRPPYGAWNDDVREVAAQQGDAIILWNVDSEDWKSRDAKATTEKVLGSVSAGSIVLLHSIHASTVQAIPDIVSGLRSKGYALVTVPQLLGGAPKPGWVYYSQHDMIHRGSTQQVDN